MVDTRRTATCFLSSSPLLVCKSGVHGQRNDQQISKFSPNQSATERQTFTKNSCKNIMEIMILRLLVYN